MFARGLIRSSSPAFLRPAATFAIRPQHTRLSFTFLTRTLSDMAAKKYTFAVFAPDYTDAEGFSRRLAVRAQHLANAKTQVEAGIQRFGGALISPETYDKPEKKLVGSLMIFEMESLEEVRKVIEDDIYYKTGVWDKENLTILPWISAAPLPPFVPEA